MTSSADTAHARFKKPVFTTTLHTNHKPHASLLAQACFVTGSANTAHARFQKRVFTTTLHTNHKSQTTNHMQSLLAQACFVTSSANTAHARFQKRVSTTTLHTNHKSQTTCISARTGVYRDWFSKHSAYTNQGVMSTIPTRAEEDAVQV